MNRMPGEIHGLTTPPASLGKPLPDTEPGTTEDAQTQVPKDSADSQKPLLPKLTISTSPMHSSLASLACATHLSPENTTDPRANSLELSVVLTPELLAVGELVAAMKRVVGVLGTTFVSLGEQTERVASLAPALKASEMLKKLRAEIATQVCDQELRALEIKALLEDAVKQTLSEEIKNHICATVEREVKERVAQELNAQIPDNLRRKVVSHRRQILEVQRSLHNSEARQHNSGLGSAALTDELRPLLRPLPSAEQPPSIAKFGLPTPVPISVVDDSCTPTASPLFPRDLKALFALKSEEAQTLVMEYGLAEQATPVTPVVAEGEADSRQRNLNKFMAHIGVVGFQMHAFPASMSSSPEDQKLRSPLIISVHPSI